MAARVALACLVFATACGNGDSSGSSDARDGAANTSSVTLTLSRDPTATPNPIAITVRVQEPQGTPAPGRVVRVTASGATLGVEDRSDGTYLARTTPTAPSGEVRIEASVEGITATAERTAIVLPLVGAKWDQPELVPGFVNTPGYEDSVEVSPDGEWLIVSSYSPIDPRCLFLQKQPTDPECQSAIGPYAAPERPGMLGADRIESPTSVHHRCDALCVTTPGGPDSSIAIPPVAAFGFHHQSDDGFAEPFVIGFAADGYSYTAFGFDFVAAPQNGAADLIFAKRPTDTYNEAFVLHATLGAPIALSSYGCPAGTPVESSPIYQKPAYTDPPGTSHGNPGLRAGHLWFDDEVATPHTISVAPVAGSFPTLTVGASVAIPIASPNGEDRVQPFFDGDRLYFGSSSNNGVSSAALTGDPTIAASWSAPESELGGEGAAVISATNRIAAVGEPSVAHPAEGRARLYFVYVIARGDGLVDWNIGRVDQR